MHTQHVNSGMVQWTSRRGILHAQGLENQLTPTHMPAIGTVRLCVRGAKAPERFGGRAASKLLGSICTEGTQSATRELMVTAQQQAIPWGAAHGKALVGTHPKNRVLRQNSKLAKTG